jgi:acetylglutamate kinase
MQRSARRPIVVKLGGSALEHYQAMMQDLLTLHASGQPLVLVHGGGTAIDQWMQRLGLPIQRQQGLRVTDAATLEVVRMVLCGQVNPELLRLATHLGGRVVGLCGADGGMLLAHQVEQALGAVGEIEAIHEEVLTGLLQQCYLPIVAPLGLGADGSWLNINADQVAAHLASALGAEALLFVSDVAGIRRADGTCLPTLTADEARILLRTGVIAGGMVPKVQAALAAAQRVPQVRVIDGREPHILLRAVCPSMQVGTRVLDHDPGT